MLCVSSGSFTQEYNLRSRSLWQRGRHVESGKPRVTPFLFKQPTQVIINGYTSQ